MYRGIIDWGYGGSPIQAYTYSISVLKNDNESIKLSLKQVDGEEDIPLQSLS